MELQERGIYQLDGGPAFIVCHGDEGGYSLFTLEEWCAYSAADTEIDSDGRVLFQGEPTGHTIADLAYAGETVGE